MNQKLIKRINDYTWMYTWSGNFPLLDCAYDKGLKFQKEHTRISGDSLRVIINLFENGIQTCYQAVEDRDRLDQFYRNRFEVEPGFMIDVVKDYRKRVNFDLKELRKIWAIKNLDKLSNKKLIELLNKVGRHLIYNLTVDIYDWYMEIALMPVLESYMKRRLGELGKAELVTEYINTLITPHQVSIIYKERQSFFNIVKLVRDNKALLEVVQKGISYDGVIKENKEIKKLIDKHFKGYVWINVYANNPPSTVLSIWNEVIDYIKNDTPLTVKAKRLGDDYDVSLIERSKVFLEEIGPSKEVKNLIMSLRRMAFLRTEDYPVMGESAYYIIPLYTEIAKRLGLTYYELKEFLPWEIADYLKENKKVKEKDLKERLKLSCFMTIDNKEYVFVGKDAQKIKDTIQTQLEVEKTNKDIFEGATGSVGKITGKVVIGTSLEGASKVKKGDILVVASASNVFDIYLRKASGIIAEFGGLTSHPVIVAREFKTPCIVGVKNITQYLKDGDLVELDADKGVVKILKNQ
ncbi:MAG: PEP-utilizing enzyme [Patescibacteria group bacterium]